MRAKTALASLSDQPISTDHALGRILGEYAGSRADNGISGELVSNAESSVGDGLDSALDRSNTSSQDLS